jgi:hypothetical protein
MRVMAKITVPVESGNRGIKDGLIAKLVQATAERWKPEAMYFGSPEGAAGTVSPTSGEYWRARCVPDTGVKAGIYRLLADNRRWPLT